MIQSCPFIDYEDLIADLTDDVEGGFINKDSVLYIVRQKTPVFCEATGSSVCPVMDYFYESPKLLSELKQMTVEDIKKICFASLNRIEDEAMKASVKLIVDDLKDYTGHNPGRNQRLCKVVFEEKRLIPMMVYYEDSDAADNVETITAGDLVKELYAESGS